MKLSQFPQIIAYNIIIYIPIKYYNFRKNHSIDPIILCIEVYYITSIENNMVYHIEYYHFQDALS